KVLATQLVPQQLTLRAGEHFSWAAALDVTSWFSYHPPRGSAKHAQVYGPMQAPLLVPAKRGFLLRRLHSLSGVVPVGVFLIEHLWTTAKARAGQASFDRAVREINPLPLLPVIEIFGIFLPLAFHAIYGVKLAFDSRPNVVKYPYSRNWLYTMQRVTGLV